MLEYDEDGIGDEDYAFYAKKNKRVLKSKSNLSMCFSYFQAGFSSSLISLSRGLSFSLCWTLPFISPLGTAAGHRGVRAVALLIVHLAAEDMRRKTRT